MARKPRSQEVERWHEELGKVSSQSMDRRSAALPRSKNSRRGYVRHQSGISTAGVETAFDDNIPASWVDADYLASSRGSFLEKAR
jgi:hypothetical protein